MAEVDGTIPMENAPNEKMEEVDLVEYKFEDFAKNNFQYNASPDHVEGGELTQPLLDLQHAGDKLAAYEVWIVIQRFMKDMADVEEDYEDRTPVMTRLRETLEDKFKDLNLEDKQAERERRKQKGGTLRRLLSWRIRKKIVPIEDQMITELEKVHFVIGNGLLRPGLRDEIYCQLCKQITNNKNEESCHYGWVLMSLCAATFAPSQKFVNYLRSFFTRAPSPELAKICDFRLRRVLINGCRCYAPTWLEVQAMIQKKPLILPVSLMDGNTKTFVVDSTSMVGELVRLVADKMSVKDVFGFSLYVALFEKASCLGNGSEYIMDSISMCEQFSRGKIGHERNAPWRLFFRKELFSPWHDSADDPVATNLIYEQIVGGLKHGEYGSQNDDEMAVLIAQKFYIDYACDNGLDEEKLDSLIPSYISSYSMKDNKNAAFWTTAAVKQYKTLFEEKEEDTLKVKENMVGYAKTKWPLLFSRYYEARRLAGPNLPEMDVIIAVNSVGIFVLDYRQEVLRHFSYPRIKSISFSNDLKIAEKSSVTIEPFKSEPYTFASPNADDIKFLVEHLVQGLRLRSIYAVAMKEHSGPGLACQKGDLMKLKEPVGDKAPVSPSDKDLDLGEGTNLRTSETGAVKGSYFHILPAIEAPPPKLLELFGDGPPAADATD